MITDERPPSSWVMKGHIWSFYGFECCRLPAIRRAPFQRAGTSAYFCRSSNRRNRDFENAQLFQAWRDKVKAVEKRIGNIAAVNALRSESERIFRWSFSESLLAKRILHNGMHTGDILPGKDLGLLKNEIALVRELSRDQCTPDLKTFLSDMEELGSASEKHGNPIVFI